MSEVEEAKAALSALEWRFRVGTPIENRRKFVAPGASVRAMAKKAGISEGSWRQLESGERNVAPDVVVAPNPRRETRESVARALDWPADAIDDLMVNLPAGATALARAQQEIEQTQSRLDALWEQRSADEGWSEADEAMAGHLDQELYSAKRRLADIERQLNESADERARRLAEEREQYASFSRRREIDSKFARLSEPDQATVAALIDRLLGSE